MKPNAYCRPLLHQIKSNLFTAPSYIYIQINGLFAVALVLEATSASSTGKLETLGSSFRHETAGLLPSLATQRQSPIYIITGQNN